LEERSVDKPYWNSKKELKLITKRREPHKKTMPMKNAIL
jgi:hypothetical protein